ncbi:MAG TPA: MarR family transcriptional regulator [Solirubrobacterales bacterium]
MSDVDHSQQNQVPLSGLLDVVKQAMVVEFEQELAKHGYGDIRPTHGCVFRFVRDSGLRLTDLAGNAGMTKQACGELVDDLVELGYVERVPDPEDRRAKLIQLTERGREAQEVGFTLFAELEKRWAERFGIDQVGGLRQTLEEIAAREVPEAVPELAMRSELARQG